jgi:WD40 repeat protein
VTNSEYSPELAAALDRLVAVDETLRADWEDVVGRAGKRARQRARLIRARPLRLALAVVAAFLLLAGVATAAYYIRQAVTAWKQPAPSAVALDDEGRLRTVWRCRAVEDCGAFVKAVALAPDGRHLALVTGSNNVLSLYEGGLHVIDLATGADRHLPATPSSPATPEAQLEAWRRLGRAETHLLGCAEPHELAWSPDGSLLAYTCTVVRGGAQVGRIYTIRPDGTGRRLLHTGTPSAYWPAWSPDGGRIVFSTGSRRWGHSAIYAVDLDGSNRQFVARAGAAPDWSPDGTTIAYWGPSCLPGSSGWTGRTRLVTPDGRDVTPHSRRGRCGGIGPAYAIPAWSPDGRRLAITSWNGLYVMDADGGHVIAIRGTDNGTFGDARPLWQPHP